MPPDCAGFQDYREWLRRAESALNLARSNPGGVCLEDLCYQAQQAAEKSIKALFVYHGYAFPFTHDIRLLLLRLAEKGVAIPDSVQETVSLTAYAVETRYPGFQEEVTEQEYNEALTHAHTVINWARDKMGEDTLK